MCFEFQKYSAYMTKEIEQLRFLKFSIIIDNTQLVHLRGPLIENIPFPKKK